MNTIRTSLLLITASFGLMAAALQAAPEFIEQPASSYTAQGGTYSYSFSVRAGDDVSFSFPDGAPFEVLQGYSASSEQSRSDGISSVRISFRTGVDAGTIAQFRISANDSTGTTVSTPFTATIVSAFFSVSQNLGNGYFQDPAMGTLYGGNPPYVYQADGLGWFALNSDATSLSAWFYSMDTNLGWMYYMAFGYPWLYVPSLNSWVYFVYQNDARWFYVQRTSEWISR